MAITVSFYTFSKRANSTKRPSTGGTDYSCNIKSASSVASPRIELNIGSSPAGYNYCYIAHYNRYYYITNWTYEPPLWVAECRTDVLATYKGAIGDASLYILRASAEYDGNITDTMYPPQLPITSSRSVTSISGWKGAFDGTYVIGIAGSNAPQLGAVTYYVTGSAGLTNLIAYMYGAAINDASTQMATDINTIMSTAATPEEGYAMSEAVIADYQARYNYNPINYIVSCKYFPFSVPQGAAQVVNMGYLSTNISLIKLSSPLWTATNTISLPRHPQSTARGEYLNLAPYTRYILNTTLFGDIELNTGEIGQATSIQCVMAVDCVSGQGYLYVAAIDSNGNRFLCGKSATVGVDIALAQSLIDKTGAAAVTAQSYMGVASGTLSGAAAGAAAGGVGAVVGGLAGGIASGVSAIDSIEKANVPRLSLNGSNGGIAITMATDYTLYSEFYSVPDEDNAHRGRPLMKVRQPKNIAGYMMVSDGDVAIDGYEGEQNEVRAYLEGGFYYE